AQGHQGNARRYFPCDSVLHRLDRRAVRRDARGSVQGFPTEERIAASRRLMRAMHPTDANQPPPYEGRNLYLSDSALQKAVVREGAAWAQARLSAWGAALGRAHTFDLAARANRFCPELRT